MAKLKQLALHPAVHVVVLSVIVWLIFARTLGSYFLADDFGEVAYASRIFNGEYNLLWSDFTSNFMQVPGMAVWRPWLMMSLFVDFCIWRANPIGFYLTNVLSYNMVVLLFYLLIRTLAAANKSKGLVALLSAALFAASPLHCESVSWVVGRVDVVCAVFYLACLNFSVFAERSFAEGKLNTYSKLLVASIVCFWLGMWTKEMAIGAPVMVTTIYLLFGQKPLDIKRSLKLAAPILVSTVIYFVLRYLALGTLLGGYVQGIGDSQAANALSRWLDPDTLRRLFFPFAYSIFGEHAWQQTALLAAYLVLFSLIALRLFTATISLRWLALIMIWTLTCLAPLYKLWGLGYELEGARFCFFLTLPLSLLAPALIMLDERAKKLPPAINCSFTTLGSLATVLATVILGKAAFHTNLDWVHAGQEVRKVASEAQRLCAEAAKEKIKILVLGIPKRHGGAHMILNGATFATSIRPPFTSTDCSTPFITFDPIQFAETPYINSDRFKKLVGANNCVVIWQSEPRSFKTLSYPKASVLPSLLLAAPQTGYTHPLGGVKTYTGPSQGLAFGNANENDSLAFSNLALSPLAADYLEVELRQLDDKKEPLQLAISIDDKNSGFYKTELKNSNTIHLPLSRDWHWYGQNSIDSLFVLLPAKRNLEISKCKLVKAEEIAAKIEVSNKQESFEGVTSIADGNKQFDTIVSLPQLDSIASIQIESSKANTFFENFPKDEGNAAVLARQIYPLTAKKLPATQQCRVTLEAIPKDCYTQLRVRLLDKNGATVGVLSNAITLHVD